MEDDVAAEALAVLDRRTDAIPGLRCRCPDEIIALFILIELEANMTTVFKREIEIGASKEEVWQALANFGDICHAHPAVLTSHVTSQQETGLGATRHCDFAMLGATSEERAIEWREGEYLKIEAYALKNLPGIKTMTVDFALRPNGTHTILTSTMEYSMQNLLFDLMNFLMMKRMNSKLLDGIVAGHKKYIEDKEIVTQTTNLEMDKVVKLI